MRNILLAFVLAVGFGTFIPQSVDAQERKTAPIETRIAVSEGKQVESMPDIVKFAHIRNLQRLYREFVRFLDAKVKEKGISATEKTRLERARAVTLDKIAIFDEFLGGKSSNNDQDSEKTGDIGIEETNDDQRTDGAAILDDRGDRDRDSQNETRGGRAIDHRGTNIGEGRQNETGVSRDTDPQTTDHGTENKANIRRTSDDGNSERNAQRPIKEAKVSKPPPPRFETAENKYKAASAEMIDSAQRMADQIIENLAVNPDDPYDKVAGFYYKMFAYSLARSVEPDDDTQSAIVNLKPLRYLPEAYRTDKQIGASSATAASTSAIDKPGFANLLGFAVENGYLRNHVQDTVLTLSTSPSAFFSSSDKDSIKAYQDAGFFNKIGVSASFNINSENPLFANATRSQLREYSVRFRFLGDHSARSRKLQKIWDDKIAPEVIKVLTEVGRMLNFVDELPELVSLRNTTADSYFESLETELNSSEFKALTIEKRRQALTNFTLNYLKLRVADEIAGGRIVLSDRTAIGLRERMNSLLQAQKAQAFDKIKETLDEFFKSPLGTLAYINHKDPLGNYSELKLLLGINKSFFDPLKLTVNAGVSFYHKPNLMINQKRIRDFDFAMSLEGNKSARYIEDGDLAPITYSFVARYQRLLENKEMPMRKADLVSTQFLLTLPIFRGVSLPLSATYSNATELEKKQGFRVNFGLKFDAEKLLQMNQLKKLIP